MQQQYDKPSLTAAVDRVIDQALAEQRLVGTVVLVAHRGATCYQRAAGLADREAGAPARLSTLFRLSSVTKPLVASAAMVLVSQGKLALDEDIRCWLPAFAPRLATGETARITLRQLLSHTSGLGYRLLEPDDNGPYAQAGISDGLDPFEGSLTENLRRLADVPLLSAPGTAWRYSLGMDVAGAIIERVSGLPLDQTVRRLVTQPLAMTDCAFSTNEVERLAVPYVNDRPSPHRLREGEWVPFSEGEGGVRYSPARVLNPAAFPSGGAGMVGTAPDVLRLLEALRQGGSSWLPDRWIDEMARDQTYGLQLDGLPGMGFGIGFAIVRDPALAQTPVTAGSWCWGGVYGHSWWVDRRRELSVVALSNTLYEGMSGRFVGDLRTAVYQTLEG
ncbi:beta-lactamase family protein [Affinibrenneria salicis]|uniref:Beta-lactamase family protein n=1 Tax=Affinibrenneria salicis TaxID=2590031 RepID=A0A5J5G1F7_9GAMM|nr:serine hydrolase domain-containing protein [Affinibrenneria salicis]KAA9000491.1 beta-lactamase family protein [Affinibrenneria salicis]